MSTAGEAMLVVALCCLLLYIVLLSLFFVRHASASRFLMEREAHGLEIEKSGHNLKQASETSWKRRLLVLKIVVQMLQYMGLLLKADVPWPEELDFLWHVFLLLPSGRALGITIAVLVLSVAALTVALMVMAHLERGWYAPDGVLGKRKVESVAGAGTGARAGSGDEELSAWQRLVVKVDSANIVRLVVDLMFVPMVTLCFSMVSCDYSASSIDQSFLIGHPDLACWEGIHVFFAVMSTTLFIVILPIGLMLAALYNSRNPEVRQWPRWAVCAVVVRVFMCGASTLLVLHPYVHVPLLVLCLTALLAFTVYFQPWLGGQRVRTLNNLSTACYACAAFVSYVVFVALVADDEMVWIALTGAPVVFVLSLWLNSKRARQFSRATLTQKHLKRQFEGEGERIRNEEEQHRTRMGRIESFSRFLDRYSMGGRNSSTPRPGAGISEADVVKSEIERQRATAGVSQV